MATTQIIAVGKMSKGSTELRVALRVEVADAEVEQFLDELLTRPAQAEPDGTLQGMIDYGAELQELQEDMADRAYWASGNW